MNALTLTLIRVAFLAVLWLFVIAAVGVVRTDLFGPAVSSRQQRRQQKAQRAKAARPAKCSARAYNRCKICGRPRAYIRKFGVCRICFRKMASDGMIPGVRKASW